MREVVEEFKKSLERGDMEHAMNGYLIMKDNKYSVKLISEKENDKNFLKNFHKNIHNNISCLEYTARPKVKVAIAIRPKKLQVKEELINLFF